MPAPIALFVAVLLQGSPRAPAAPTVDGSARPAATRPAHDRDPWVFRCVLDDNPRMLIISLGDNWWMAFNTVDCSIYKIWNGEIELTGAVYDTKHGPQPHAKGRFVLDGKSPIQFFVGKNDKTAEWGGYQLRGDAVTLNWTQNDVAFKLTPNLQGDALRLEVEHTPINKSAELSVTLPNWLAMIPDSIEPQTDRDGSGPIDAAGTFAIPNTGPLTIKLSLVEKHTDNQEPKQ